MKTSPETLAKAKSDVAAMRAESDPQSTLHNHAPLFDQALTLFRHGRLAEAEETARSVVQIAPQNFRALHLLGIIFSGRGDHVEGLRFIDAALQINSEASLHNSRGNVLAALKRFEEALASFEIAIARDPRSPLAFGNRGNVYRELGRFEEAIASYDAAIALDPNDAEIFYNRGIALQDLKRFDKAIASYDQAIALKPDYAEAFSNRGTVLQALGRLAEAVTSYDRAIELQPNFPEALFSRGSAFHELKQFDKAISSYNEAIAIKPDFVEALNYRGISFERLKRLPEAIASFDMAIAVNPGYAEAIVNRGKVLAQLKRFDDALASYDRAIELEPNFTEAFNDRGVVLSELERFDEALASYDKAIELKPDFAEALNNRGAAFNQLKRFDEALASYDRAIQIKSDFAEAFNNRGVVLYELRRFDEALASYERAIDLKPDYAEAFNNRGVVLGQLKRLDDALASYDRATDLRPDYVDALNNRGAALSELGRLDEALASYEQGAANDDRSAAVSGIADCALKLNDWRRVANIAETMKTHIIEQRSIIQPFLLLGYCSDAAVQLKCAENYRADKIVRAAQPLHKGAIWRNDKIRVAYLSADFRQHPMAYLIGETFELHDRSRFEVIGISFSGDDGSAIRSRIIGSFDRFYDVATKSDRDVASLVHGLKVDIAIDLMGYTKDSRTGVFAYRPAPIQVSYLGYPGTMGADFIDYVIADEIVLPFDLQAYYTEKIVHLPECYWVNDSKKKIGSRQLTRQELGLPEIGLVFCCFNNNYKITAPVFDIWMRLLRAVDDSVLWLLRTNSSAEKNLRREAAARGVDPSRLVFADRMPMEDHLGRHRFADLFLDTLPYNAHTTASDALWTGVPVITCCGQSFAGRVAASLLNAIGLAELVTYNLEEYEALALRLARNRSLLADVKAKLGHNRNRYPLFNCKRFTRHLEAAYATMWQIWQHGEQPRSFAVEPNS